MAIITKTSAAIHWVQSEGTPTNLNAGSATPAKIQNVDMKITAAVADIIDMEDILDDNITEILGINYSKIGTADGQKNSGTALSINSGGTALTVDSAGIIRGGIRVAMR